MSKKIKKKHHKSPQQRREEKRSQLNKIIREDLKQGQLNIRKQEETLE